MGLLRKRKGKGSGIGSSGGGSAPLDTPLFQAITVQAGEISTDVIRGAGSATFTRSTLDYVRDPDNVYRKVQANEARIQGARRVENLCTHSTDLTDASWGGDTTANATETATTIELTGTNNSYHYKGIPVAPDVTGRTYTLSADVTWVSGATTVGIRGLPPTGTDDEVALDLSDLTTKRVSVTIICNTDGNVGIGLDNRSAVIAGVDTGPTKVTFTNINCEEVSNQSNTSPNVHIATTGSAVAKYYTTTNGNSVASNVVTEAAGLDLHPTVSKKGANVLARYATRGDSTAYVLGDRVITSLGSGTAGGNGYVYECTTAGTTAASEGTFSETIAATTTDGTAVFTNMGHYKIAGYLGEPAATNNAIQNRDFSNAAWVKTNITGAKTATGIDGVANSASTLTATAANGTAFQTVTIASAAFNTSFFVKRKTGTGTVEITDNDGTNYTAITLTTEWLRFDIDRTQANPVFGFRIVTDTDAIEVDFSHLEAASVPSSPIPTTTVAVTRVKDVLSYTASGNLVDAGGVLFTSYRTATPTNGARVIDDTVLNRPMIYQHSTFKPLAYDGTNGSTQAEAVLAANISQQAGVRWETTTDKMQSFGDGVSGTEGSYDGSWNYTAVKILDDYSSASPFQGTISDIRIYNKDLGTALCESLTSAD